VQPAPRLSGVPFPEVPPKATPQENVSSLLPTMGIVVGSVGLAGVVAGVALNVKANQAANSGSDSSQKSYKTAALLCYGLGGAAWISGIVLYLVGSHSRT
jgi:hypothetical protein